MTNGHDIDQFATYQIKVKGNLDPSWSDWFGGFNIQPKDDETILVGIVIDQSALHGILAKINELGLMLLSVNKLQVESVNPEEKYHE
jgi:hypothetical protein